MEHSLIILAFGLLAGAFSLILHLNYRLTELTQRTANALQATGKLGTSLMESIEALRTLGDCNERHSNAQFTALGRNTSSALDRVAMVEQIALRLDERIKELEKVPHETSRR